MRKLISVYLKNYLKEVIILAVFIIGALFYQREPKYELPLKPVLEGVQIQNTQIQDKGNETEDSLAKEEEILRKTIEFFGVSGSKEKLEHNAEIKMPSLEEIWISHLQSGRIKILSIFGKEKERKALIVDPTNNSIILKKGQKIVKGLTVKDIKEVSVIFKMNSGEKEVFLYGKSTSPVNIFQPPSKGLEPQFEEPPIDIQEGEIDRGFPERMPLNRPPRGK